MVQCGGSQVCCHLGPPGAFQPPGVQATGSGNSESLGVGHSSGAPGSGTREIKTAVCPACSRHRKPGPSSRYCCHWPMPCEPALCLLSSPGSGRSPREAAAADPEDWARPCPGRGRSPSVTCAWCWQKGCLPGPDLYLLARQGGGLCPARRGTPLAPGQLKSLANSSCRARPRGTPSGWLVRSWCRAAGGRPHIGQHMLVRGGEGNRNWFPGQGQLHKSLCIQNSIGRGRGRRGLGAGWASCLASCRSTSCPSWWFWITRRRAWWWLCGEPCLCR